MNQKHLLLIPLTMMYHKAIITVKPEELINPKTKPIIDKVIQVKSTQSTGSLTPGDVLNIVDFKKGQNGILYKTIKTGSGEKPVKGNVVTVNYVGNLLIDGNKVGLQFDSSFKRNAPFNFKLGAQQVIPGWELTLLDMKMGETRIVILPSNLAYGKRALGNIPADSTLLFEISLLKIS